MNVDHAPGPTLILPSWSEILTEALIERVYSFSAGSSCTGMQGAQTQGDVLAGIRFWCLKVAMGSLWMYRGTKSLRQRNNGVDHVIAPLFVMSPFPCRICVRITFMQHGYSLSNPQYIILQISH